MSSCRFLRPHPMSKHLRNFWRKNQQRALHSSIIRWRACKPDMVWQVSNLAQLLLQQQAQLSALRHLPSRQDQATTIQTTQDKVLLGFHNLQHFLDWVDARHATCATNTGNNE